MKGVLFLLVSGLIAGGMTFSSLVKAAERNSAGVCTLTGGELVANGWSGNDSGSNSCNSCFCKDAVLACTKMACSHELKSCTLTGGEIVLHGWSGKDTGANFCNNCSCNDGQLRCTLMGCMPRL